MELILLQDVSKIGHKGEVVRVRDGFARNFLLPKRLAILKTQASAEYIERLRVRVAKRRAQEKEAAQKQAELLNQLKIQIKTRVGEQGKLFGSVTAEHVCDLLKQQGYEFRKKQVILRQPIRSVGVHPVRVEVYPQVKATVSVEVVSES